MSETKKHYLELGIEFCLELAIGLYQLGAEQMDLPHNFYIGLFLWVVATALAVRMFWIFPWIERWPSWIKVSVAMLGIGLLVAFAWSPVEHAYNKKNTGPVEGQQNSSSGQSNKGDGSNNTNINGNNNTVKNTIVINRSDPTYKARFDAIEKLLEDQKDQLAPKNLLDKYPLGYVIFNINYDEKVFPYHSEALQAFDIDWNAAKLIDLGDKVNLFFPYVRYKGRTLLEDVSFVLQKKPNRVQSIMSLGRPGVDHIAVKGEILKITDDGIVYLVGFTSSLF